MDDEALFALARGELSRPELERVEAHLRDCSDCRAVLGEAARSLASEGAPHEPSTQIARYQLRGLIGAGSSGVVYRAYDPNLRRSVAIKVIRPDLHASPELSARMLREAQAMARLSHPNVVTVHDVGVQDGAVYLVMEHVDGLTLSFWLHDAVRSASDVLRVFRDAGRGLAAAHDKGLVHLDFKPENVLIAADGRALVTDFGLAREAELRASEAGAAAQGDHDAAELYAPTRGLMGTPAYMAPELFDGGVASARSDQFAYCVALFTALAGRHPFGAGEGIPLVELLERVRATSMLPASALRAAHAEALWRVLRRGLDAEPARRFADMAELLTAIERTSTRAWLARPAWLAAALTLVAGSVILARVWVEHPVTQRPQTAPSVEVTTPVEPVLEDTHVDATIPVVSPAKPIRERPRSKRPAPPPEAREPREVWYRDGLKDPF